MFVSGLKDEDLLLLHHTIRLEFPEYTGRTLDQVCQPPMGGTRGGGTGDPDPPPENDKNIVFLSNTGPVPLKITKLQSQQSMLGHHRHSSETPFKWRSAGVLMLAL